MIAAATVAMGLVFVVGATYLEVVVEVIEVAAVLLAFDLVSLLFSTFSLVFVATVCRLPMRPLARRPAIPNLFTPRTEQELGLA